MDPAPSDILTDLSPASLAAAHKANLHSFVRRAELSPAMDYEYFRGFERWSSAHPSDMLNGALSVRDATEADACDVDITIEYFRVTGTRVVTWWLEDGVEPEGWRRLLTERGFTVVSGAPGMAIDLSTLPETAPVPEGATIRKATHVENLRPLARIITRVFGFHLESERAVYEWAAGMGVEWPTLSYVAYVCGRPAGASIVHYGGGVAGIYFVAVEPEAGSSELRDALTLAPLFEARDLGYKAGVLQSPDMAMGACQRLGFREHSRVDHFILTLSESVSVTGSPICDAQARLAGAVNGTTGQACDPGR